MTKSNYLSLSYWTK